LEEDYIRKAHAGLNGQSPHDVFMSQVSKLKLVNDVMRINENFLLRITRKIQPDAIIQIDNVLYETDSMATNIDTARKNTISYSDMMKG
jgi:hypothetical protein